MKPEICLILRDMSNLFAKIGKCTQQVHKFQNIFKYMHTSNHLDIHRRPISKTVTINFLPKIAWKTPNIQIILAISIQPMKNTSNLSDFSTLPQICLVWTCLYAQENAYGLGLCQDFFMGIHSFQRRGVHNFQTQYRKNYALHSAVLRTIAHFIYSYFSVPF